MTLTDPQKATLKAHILANTAQQVVDGLTNGDNGAIADWYNQQESPDFFVFINSVSADDVGRAIELDDIANMTTGDVAKLEAFFRLRSGGFSGESATDRAGFDDVLSAAAADDSQQAVAALWQRLANRIEKLFSIGTGSLIDPAIAPYTGAISYQDIGSALNS